MPRSDPPRSIDWRGWLALAWVAWFGLLYGKMVIERRGDTLRAAVPALTANPSPAGGSRR